jgi:hypothetical protein
MFEANPALRASKAMRCALQQCLREKREGKGRRPWESLVGYDLDSLKRVLESKFLPGMSWENYGKTGWHIDHKVPQSWFHYESTDDWQFKVCWSLANLQPMWAHENYSKGNRQAM